MSVPGGRATLSPAHDGSSKRTTTSSEVLASGSPASLPPPALLPAPEPLNAPSPSHSVVSRASSVSTLRSSVSTTTSTTSALPKKSSSTSSFGQRFSMKLLSSRRSRSAMSEPAGEAADRRAREEEEAARQREEELKSKRQVEDDQIRLQAIRQVVEVFANRSKKSTMRIGGAVLLMRARVDEASADIRAEMHDLTSRTTWDIFSEGAAVYLASLALWTLARWGFAPGDRAWATDLLFAAVAGGALLLYCLSQRARARDAVLGAEVVAGRLEDLDLNVHVCFDSIGHNIEADAEWEKVVSEEQRRWSARQAEHGAKRGRLIQRVPLNPLHEQRRRMLDEKMKSVLHSIQNVSYNLMHAPGSLLPINPLEHIPAVPSLRKKKARKESPRVEFESKALVFHPDAPPAFMAYARPTLEVERSREVREDERAVFDALAQQCQAWPTLPKDLQLMVLRGYADRKEKRLEASAAAAQYIANWREQTSCESILRSVSESAVLFNRAWPTLFGGYDDFGHVLVVDRVEDMNTGVLTGMPEEEILLHRTQQMEVVRAMKLRRDEHTNSRSSKHVYIMDLKGLTLGMFSSKVRRVIFPIFKVSGEGYPDSMWSLWLINTPTIFRGIWNVIAPALEASTKSKIRMVGGKSTYLPEMQRCGVPLSCIPVELGGEHASLSLLDVLNRIVENQGELPADFAWGEKPGEEAKEEEEEESEEEEEEEDEDDEEQPEEGLRPEPRGEGDR